MQRLVDQKRLVPAKQAMCRISVSLLHLVLTAQIPGIRLVAVSFALELHVSASVQMYACTATAYQCLLHMRCSSVATFSSRSFSLESLRKTLVLGVTECPFGNLKEKLVMAQEGRMPAHLDHMREHVVHGTTTNSNNIAVDRSVHLATLSSKPRVRKQGERV